jgi:hypothetical protein
MQVESLEVGKEYQFYTAQKRTPRTVLKVTASVVEEGDGTKFAQRYAPVGRLYLEIGKEAFLTKEDALKQARHLKKEEVRKLRRQIKKLTKELEEIQNDGILLLDGDELVFGK